MIFFETKDMKITVDKSGSSYYSKISYPLRFGKFTEIETKDYIFFFNLKNEIKIIQGKNGVWSNSNEWIKRTSGGDFVYYSSAGYKSAFSFIGEYYLPCFAYSDNPIFEVYGYDKKIINAGLNALNDVFEKIKTFLSENPSHTIRHLLEKIVENYILLLNEKADEFHNITEGYITVLPPDARHVDYDVIPVNVADGCLYKCGFCSVKTKKKFKVRDKKDIFNQIKQLKEFYGEDIYNYNSIFLGEHDALNADTESIIYAAETGYKEFDFKNSNMKNPMLFMFGSVDSLINSKEDIFNLLEELPFYTYINIGMESADQETLKILKKPITVDKVKAAFKKMIEINKKYKKIEITANFVMNQNFSDRHYESISELAKSELKKFYTKGGFYISPLENSGTTRYIQKRFLQIKNINNISSYIYLIQRL